MKRKVPWIRIVTAHAHLQAYEKREETRLGDDHPEALVITVQTNECLGIVPGGSRYGSSPSTLRPRRKKEFVDGDDMPVPLVSGRVNLPCGLKTTVNRFYERKFLLFLAVNRHTVTARQ